MKTLLILLPFFMFGDVLAQSKFSLGITGSLDATKMVPDITAMFNKTGLGYSSGLRARYDVTNCFSIQTGLSMVSTQYIADRKGSDLAYWDAISDGMLKDQSVNIHSSLDRLKLVTDIKSFQVPVLCSFYFGDQLKFGFTAGPAFNYAYRRNGELTWYDSGGESGTVSATNKIKGGGMYLSAIAGVGCEYSLKKFIFRIEPTAQYGFNHEVDYEKGYYQPWSIGLGISSFYRF